MFQVKEQTITDANTGVQVAFGRHDNVPLADVPAGDPSLDNTDRPAAPSVAQPSQWMRITAGGKVSTVFFTPDGDIRNIQAHPPLPGPGNDPATDEAQPWKPTLDGKPSETEPDEDPYREVGMNQPQYTYDETSKAIDADIADDNADDAKTAEEIAEIDNAVAQRKSREAAKALVNEDFKPPSGSVPPVATPPIEG